MAGMSDVITHTVERDRYEMIIENSRKAEIGGKSQIRNGESRARSLAEDQLVGQIATYCGSMVITGSQIGYVKARNKANESPFEGDGGVDIFGLENVDIKGSLMRYSKDPLKYRLLVRERERHDGWIYVLGLVPGNRPYRCHLVGWAFDSDLPEEEYNGPIASIKGAYVVEAESLRKMKDLIERLR